MFDMALHGSSTLDIAKALNSDGVPSPFGAKWLKATIKPADRDGGILMLQRLGGRPEQVAITAEAV